MRQPGRHFLQIPGPSVVPVRILRAIAMPVADHRQPGFADLGKRILIGIQSIFKTEQPVFSYPAPGTGAWEAARVNTLSAGDKVLVETAYSPVLTAVRVPDDTDADALRAVILKHCNMSLGNGLSEVQGKVFSIGHLRDFNDVMLLGTLGSMEMGLHLANVSHQKGGTQAAFDYLKSSH